MAKYLFGPLTPGEKRELEPPALSAVPLDVVGGVGPLSQVTQDLEGLGSDLIQVLRDQLQFLLVGAQAEILRRPNGLIR